MTPINKETRKVEDLSEAELKHLKLIEEIKSLKKPIYRDPGFLPAILTVIIAAFATIYSYKSGLFETKGKIIELQTLQLEQKRDSLNKERKKLMKQVDSLNSQVGSLRNLVGSYKLDIDRKNRQEDSIKKIYRVAKEKAQTRKELKVQISTFLDELITFINNYNKKKAQLNDQIHDAEYKAYKTSNQKLQDSLYFDGINKYALFDKEEDNEFRKKYAPLLLAYREKIFSFQPELEKISLLQSKYEFYCRSANWADDAYNELFKLNNSLKN